MKYLIGILLLILNLYAFQYGMNSIAFFCCMLALVVLYYSYGMRKSRKFFVLSIELLCFCWPFSWNNIFGGSTVDNPITWFYVIGLLFFIALISDIREGKVVKRDTFILPCLFFLILYSFIPLVMSYDFESGLTDFILIEFFLLLSFASFTTKRKLEKKEFYEIIEVFIFVNFISSLVLIFQYVMYKFFGMHFFKMTIMGSFASNSMQIGSGLLFEDASSATIMLGCGVIFALLYAGKNRRYYFHTLLILIGIALTGRRTGVIALMLTIPFVFLSKNKSLIKKVLSLTVVGMIVALLIFIISLSRPFDNISDLFSNNGRFVDYVTSIDLMIEKPFGIGFGDEYLATQMARHIPHNTFLRWINFGGFIYAIPFIIVIIGTLFVAKKSNPYIYWALFNSILAANFIPDILNARFFVILCILSYMYKEELNNEIKG